jgi:hypothetical protein
MIVWQDKNGNISIPRPFRIRLADKSTLTGVEVTDNLLYEFGWTEVDIDMNPQANVDIDTDSI